MQILSPAGFAGICLAVLVCGTSSRLGDESEDQIKSMWAVDEDSDAVVGLGRKKRNWRLSCAEFSVMQSLADENAQYSEPEQALRAAFVETCKFKDTETGPYAAFEFTRREGEGGNGECVFEDYNFAAAQVVRDTKFTPAEKYSDDRLLFDLVRKHVSAPKDIIGWGPNFFHWMDSTASNMSDITLKYEPSSTRPEININTNPDAWGQWRSDRGTVISSAHCLCWHYHVHKGSTGQHPPITKPYVLVTDLGDNWGKLSSLIPGRSADWGTLASESSNCAKSGKYGPEHVKAGQGLECTVKDIEAYFDEPNLLAVVTSQHQDPALSITRRDKLISIPLGIHELHVKIAAEVLAQLDGGEYPKKTSLIMLANSCYSHRAATTKVVQNQLSSYHTNIHGLITQREFNMAIASAKFVWCPCGMGVDSYRIWTVLMFGSIPVIEMSKGWHHTLDALPVLWIDNLEDLSDELLIRSWPKLLAKSASYDFKRLTPAYWDKLVTDLTAAA